MASFAIIIISVNFQLKQLSVKFLPLTISYSCCSIPMYIFFDGTLDILMTDVPDLVRVAVVASSDHSSLSAVISIAQEVPNLCESSKVFPTHQVN